MILGESPTLLFVEKPAGIPVFPPHADPEGDCVLRRLLALRPEQGAGFPPGFAGGLAHRLDTLTGGFVVAARTPGALAALREAWPRVRKFYRFHSAGEVAFDSRLLTEAIAHHPRRADRVVVRSGRIAHRGRWREAWTRLSRLGEGWWEAEIRTGVLHQVRAHAALAGVPLTGDPIYGGAPGPIHLVHVGIEGEGWSFRLPHPPGPERPPAG